MSRGNGKGEWLCIAEKSRVLNFSAETVDLGKRFVLMWIYTGKEVVG
jgi:hypothetical protein